MLKKLKKKISENNVRFPPISVTIKTLNSEGGPLGDTVFSFPVNGNQFDLANALRNLATVLAGMDDAQTTIASSHIVVLLRKGPRPL